MKRKRGFFRTAGKLAAYSGVAVLGLVGTRFIADLAARGNKNPIPLWGTLLGTWSLAALATWKWGGAYSTAALVGSGVAVLDEGFAHALKAGGFGPRTGMVLRPDALSGVCPVQTQGPFPTPSLFRPAARDACDANFWRGRWVGCRKADGTIERRWCHDSYGGGQCCPGQYVAMSDWPARV